MAYIQYDNMQNPKTFFIICCNKKYVNIQIQLKTGQLHLMTANLVFGWEAGWW